MLKDPQNYTYEYVKQKITNLPTKIKQITALAYATGSRVSELNQIKKINIKQTNNYLKITCPVLKKRNNQNNYRIALVRLDEEWLSQPIKSLIQNKQEEEVLVPFHRATIYRWLVTYTGWNPHAFRKLRATHLVSEHNFNGQQLKYFFDWSRSDMADNYVKLNTKSIEY